jgi:glycosyltransferase involved in cell wall biosynthesis
MNEKNPEISIAMATFNGEKFLREQLDSILRQTFSDFELIISDDGSADETMTILTEYEKIDPRIKIVQNSGEHGVVQNFQNALKICRGKFIAFSDQDDVWTDDHLQTLLDVLGENFLACANADLVDKNLVPLGSCMKEKFFVTEKNLSQLSVLHLAFGNFCQGATILFRRELLDFLPVSDGMMHDHFFAVCAEVAGGISYSPKSILKYRQHENNAVGAKNFTLYERFMSLKKNCDLRRIQFQCAVKITEKAVPKISAERLKFVQQKIKIAKSILYGRNLLALKKHYDEIFWDENRRKFLMRCVIVLLF